MWPVVMPPSFSPVELTWCEDPAVASRPEALDKGQGSHAPGSGLAALRCQGRGEVGCGCSRPEWSESWQPRHPGCRAR
jgi:hypothetical protein